MTDEKHRCSTRLFKRFSYCPCEHAAKVERDGKWYCGRHDPEAVKRRDDKRNARWDEEERARIGARERANIRTHRIDKLIADAAGDVATREELRELAKLIGR